MTSKNVVVHAPETIEGWFALHQVFRRADGEGPLKISTGRRDFYPDGWSGMVQLIGSRGHLMMIHFYPTLDRIAEAQQAVSETGRGDPIYSFLSVTEAGLYHISAQLAADAEERGGSVGDEIYRARMAERVRAEKESDHVKRRLYPPPPAAESYVCFYPMSKRRQSGQNWYTLSLEERSRLMQAHAPAQLTVPVLFMTGELDDRTPVGNDVALATEFANSIRLVVANGGHELLPDRAVQAVVVDFFAGRDVRGRVLQDEPPRFLSIAEAKQPPRRRGQ
jgi:hypothetical protein